jgi:hypothetical protein
MAPGAVNRGPEDESRERRLDGRAELFRGSRL